jgi:hypothetical protein
VGGFVALGCYNHDRHKRKKIDQTNTWEHKDFNVKNPFDKNSKITGASQQIFNIYGTIYTTPEISQIGLILCSGLQEVHITVKT